MIDGSGGLAETDFFVRGEINHTTLRMMEPKQKCYSLERFFSKFSDVTKLTT